MRYNDFLNTLQMILIIACLTTQLPKL